MANGNIFAFTAAETAFAHGEEWLRQMLDYLNGNVHTLADFLHTRMPKVKAVLPEASYLAWLDFSAYGLPHKELVRRLIEDAKVVLNDGTTFGVCDQRGATAERSADYECCFRLNIGCPKGVLIGAMERIAEALEK